MVLEQQIELNKQKYSPIKKWLKLVSEVWVHLDQLTTQEELITLHINQFLLGRSAQKSEIHLEQAQNMISISDKTLILILLKLISPEDQRHLQLESGWNWDFPMILNVTRVHLALSIILLSGMRFLSHLNSPSVLEEKFKVFHHSLQIAPHLS